jgi:hypothetical protein
MKSIFQNASRVVVWLGPSNFISSDAFALLHSLETYQSSHDAVHKIIQDPNRNKEWRALINLFKRSYWRRVWVVQEVQVARTITLLCGDDSIEWSSLLKILGMLWDEHAAALITLAQSTSLLRNLQYWIRRRGARGLDKVPLSPQCDLFRTLLFHRLKQSTHPRDKIYGLLGLSNASGEIEVDYRQDVRQVYIDTVSYVIRSTGTLDVLWAVPPNRDGFNLPSWVPDWSVDEKMQAELAWGLQESKLEYIYHASGKTRAEATVDSGKGTLVARGIVVTSVKYRGGVAHMTHSRDIRQAVVAVHEWRRLVNDRVGDDADLTETFMTTLRCGRVKLDEGDPYESLRRKTLAILQTIEELKTEAQIKALNHSMDNYKIRVNAEIEDLAQLIFKRRFILSPGGIMGLAPEEAQVGDLVCVLLGCSIPVVLRAIGKRFRYIGDVHLHGYMSGRAVAEGNEGDLNIKDFEIH